VFAKPKQKYDITDKGKAKSHKQHDIIFNVSAWHKKANAREIMVTDKEHLRFRQQDENHSPIT